MRRQPQRQKWPDGQVSGPTTSDGTTGKLPDLPVLVSPPVKQGHRLQRGCCVRVFGTCINTRVKDRV